MALPPYQISKVINGGHRQTDRQTGDLISLLSILESRLKELYDHYNEALTNKMTDCRRF
jgi:hypothetical protein